jgi:hypothetical protein
MVLEEHQVSKPTHPTARSLRQGQTIYVPALVFDGHYGGIVVAFQIGNTDTPLPPEGCELGSIVNRAYVRRGPMQIMYYSRKRAESAMARSVAQARALARLLRAGRT